MSDWALVKDFYNFHINLDRVNYIQTDGANVLVYFSGQAEPLSLNQVAASKLLAGKMIFDG